MLTCNMAILGCCGDPSSAGSWKVVSGVSCLKAVRKAINGRDVDSKRVGNLSRRNPSFELTDGSVAIVTGKSWHCCIEVERHGCHLLGVGNL